MAITTTAPALSIGLSLPIPRLMRDYAGPVQLPQIYRATLSGSPAIAIPISSFSLRRNATSATLTLVSPYADADQIDAILARSTGALTLSRGVRFLDGSESLDVFLAAPLTSAGIRYDLGAKSGSLTLTATTDDSPAPGIVRTVRGISYRSVTDGKRRIRCALDQYLVPGDVANLGGGETMTVTEMSCSVDSQAANMEIAE